MKIFFWGSGVLAALYLAYWGIIELMALLFVDNQVELPFGAISIFLVAFMYSAWAAGLAVYCVLLGFGSPLPMAYVFYRWFPGVRRSIAWGTSIVFGFAVIYVQMQLFFPRDGVAQSTWRMFELPMLLDLDRLLVYGGLAVPLMFCGLFTFHNDLGKAMLVGTNTTGNRF